jgi:hypothetical protein
MAKENKVENELGLIEVKSTEIGDAIKMTDAERKKVAAKILKNIEKEKTSAAQRRKVVYETGELVVKIKRSYGGNNQAVGKWRANNLKEVSVENFSRYGYCFLNKEGIEKWIEKYGLDIGHPQTIQRKYQAYLNPPQPKESKDPKGGNGGNEKDERGAEALLSELSKIVVRLGKIHDEWKNDQTHRKMLESQIENATKLLK